MASLLLGCGAFFSDRLNERQKSRRESKREYDEHFDEFKAENLRRESWIRRNDKLTPTPSGIYDTATVPSEQPPAYDVAAARQ
jgi:hypothetical protein